MHKVRQERIISSSKDHMEVLHSTTQQKVPTHQKVSIQRYCRQAVYQCSTERSQSSYVTGMSSDIMIPCDSRSVYSSHSLLIIRRWLFIITNVILLCGSGWFISSQQGSYNIVMQSSLLLGVADRVSIKDTPSCTVETDRLQIQFNSTPSYAVHIRCPHTRMYRQFTDSTDMNTVPCFPHWVLKHLNRWKSQRKSDGSRCLL